MLRPEVDMPAESWLPRIPAFLTIQRWAFEPALATDRYAKSGVMIQAFPEPARLSDAPLDFMEFENGSLPGCFFNGRSAGRTILLPVAALAASAFLFLAVSYRYLQKRYLN